ncbi:MAG TPA: N-acyl homoserine lactonase family protein [Solirubrobacteraceae bacterium]|nr:N-acyl homoserine lactonase family protein [Solirubrobacteraceae bacterium]
MAGAELYLFSSGTLGLQGIEVPVPFYLIRHLRGNVLVDGGNPLAVARDAHAHWGALADVFTVHMSEEQHCGAQLSRLGIAPEAIGWIVQTHLHIDHAGALGHFPAARVLVHAAELESARTIEHALAHGYVRADYEQPELDWQPFEGDLDLFGDGAVMLLQTPGHSAGHVSLLLELEQTGSVLLTADAVDNRAQWEGSQSPRALHSADEAARSRERLRGIARELASSPQGEPLLVFGHDPENWSRLEHAPEHYH